MVDRNMIPMKMEVPTGKAAISEVYWGMRIFDSAGCFVGRIYFSDEGSFELRYPDGATNMIKPDALKHSIESNLWVCQPDDPAVLHRWRSEDDLPSPAPGQSFNDGHELGVEEAREWVASSQEPPDGLFGPEKPPRLTGDDFNDGWTTGFDTTTHRLMIEKFKDHPIREEQHQASTLDPTDAAQVVSHQEGYELARNQDAWLPRLNADQLCDKWIQKRAFAGEPVKHIRAFRRGFYEGMESTFPNRY